MSRLSIFLLFEITLLGIFFRIINISPFNVYPDSYQSLIVAKNIMDYQSVVGFLGINGMTYPDFFSWTHPVYPLLIILLNLPIHNMILTARIISFSAGVLAIPLSYLYIKQIFQSSKHGLAAAFLVAFSQNHTVWSGFLMTETIGVCMMLLFLVAFFTHDTNKRFNKLLIPFSGIFLAFAVLTRYEYILILFPLALYLFFNGRQLMRFVTMFFAFIVVITLAIWQFYPLPSTFNVIGDQLGSLLQKEGLLLFLLFSVILCITFLSSKIQHKIVRFGNLFLIGILWLVNVYLLVQEFFGTPTWFLYSDLSALRNFLIHDELLSIFSLIGYTLLLTKNKTKLLGMFSFFSAFSLFVIYHRINPAMERYMTHLIPFLLIPASYGFITSIQEILQIRKHKKNYLIVILIIILLQSIFTIIGMKYSQDTSWYRISYEDRAAVLIKKYIHYNKNVLLLTSYPEPYYYALSLSTQSLADTYPYIFIDSVPSNQQIIIIEDMGMHEDFPKFTSFLDNNLKEKKIATFLIHEKFHHIATIEKETHPIIVYKTTLKDLKTKIK